MELEVGNDCVKVRGDNYGVGEGLGLGRLYKDRSKEKGIEGPGRVCHEITEGLTQRQADTGAGTLGDRRPQGAASLMWGPF